MSELFPADLHPLVRMIERDLHGRPDSVLGPLRDLLKRSSTPAQLCYAWQQLGFAHLRLAEHRMARIFYEQALAYAPNDFYVLANLAHAVYELGDKAKAVEYGRRALHLKDVSAMAAGAIELATPHGGRRNLISFSLYGGKAKYCETAVLNCIAARQHYPGFVCRFYVDASVPAEIVRRLRAHSAEIVVVEGRAARFFGMFWRFLALDDKDADRVLVRDADSIIDARESYCVNEWIRSGKPFHIIRDDCCHTELIQGGLFAARAGIISDVEDKIAGFAASREHQPIGIFSDQLFLRQRLWPAVRDHALTHDSVYGYGTEVRDIPSEIPNAPGIRNQFIGASHASYALRVSTQAPLEDGDAYALRITDEAGEPVCEYEMEQVSGQELEILLPLSYVQRMQAGAWAGELHAFNRKTGLRALVVRLFRQ